LQDGLIVQTQQGKLAGEEVGKVRRWLGVHYASAPRFEAPQPPPAWEGVREAKTMAPQCAQGMMGRTMFEGPAYGEDCLGINIWAPAAQSAHARPVLFWIHGGAFMGGSVNPYDGAELAECGDMVVVGINYRVGAIGFANFGEALGIPSIPSNLGLRDQIAALKWVHDNIAAFGGDPARVTICGQSAGSMSVSLLMLAKQAWPYFSAAIMQSGAVSLIHDREMSLKVARRYAEVLDLDQGSLEKLKTMPIKTLLDAQTEVQKSIGESTIPAAPWYDGDLLPASLVEAHNAPVAPVPLIAGFTRDEIRTFEFLGGAEILPMKRESLERIVRAQLPEQQAKDVLGAYPSTSAGRRALATDLTFGMATRNFAERHARTQPCYFYRFDYAHPIAGAFHGIDLIFMWPITGPMGMFLRGGPAWGARRALGDRLKTHIIHFVHNGRPAADWPAFTADRRATMVFNLKDKIVDDPESARRLAWQGKDVGPGISVPFG
jgi:para-nitrobenzyl esterase